jgi:hypothetical protein
LKVHIGKGDKMHYTEKPVWTETIEEKVINKE